MRLSQRGNIYVGADRTEVLNAYFFSPLVFVLIRYIDAFVKRIAFS
jgi:hypothetical protein